MDIHEEIDKLLTDKAKKNRKGQITFRYGTVKKVASMLDFPSPYPEKLIEEIRTDMINQYLGKGHVKKSSQYYGHYNSYNSHRSMNTILVFLAFFVLLFFGIAIYAIWHFIHFTNY